MGDLGLLGDEDGKEFLQFTERTTEPGRETSLIVDLFCQRFFLWLTRQDVLLKCIKKFKEFHPPHMLPVELPFYLAINYS